MELTPLVVAIVLGVTGLGFVLAGIVYRIIRQ